MPKCKGFVFWPADFEAATNRLSGEACGAYIRLLSWMYREGEGQCSIPNEPDALAIGTKIADPVLLKRIMGEIQNKYAPLLKRENGKLVSTKLRQIVAEKAVRSRECSKAGKQGAAKKQADAAKTEADAGESQADAAKKQALLAGAGAGAGAVPVPAPVPVPALNLKPVPDRKNEPKGKQPESAGDILKRTGGQVQKEKPLLEQLLALEQEPERMRTYWTGMLRLVLAQPGGESFMRDQLKEISDRQVPKLRDSKGFSPPAKKPIAVLVAAMKKWLKDRGVTV